MSLRIERQGDCALKHLSPNQAHAGGLLAKLSSRLSRSGVRTPAMLYDACTNTLNYRWINGTTARERLKIDGSDRARSTRHPDTTIIEKVLAQLVALHRCDLHELPLQPFDPLRRIRPRVEKHRSVGNCPYDAEYATLNQALVRYTGFAGLREPITLTAVHGDFHVGQVVLDAETEQAWLLDLDDVALGEPESDLGNFVAHAVTSPELCSGSIADSYLVLERQAARVYRKLGGLAIDALALRAYGMTALLRRALKLDERGITPSLPGTILAAIASIRLRP